MVSTSSGSLDELVGGYDALVAQLAADVPNISKRWSLNQVFGEPAFLDAGSAAVPPPPEIVSVSAAGGEISIVLRRQNGVEASIILDHELNVVGSAVNEE